MAEIHLPIVRIVESGWGIDTTRLKHTNHHTRYERQSCLENGLSVIDEFNYKLVRKKYQPCLS